MGHSQSTDNPRSRNSQEDNNLRFSGMDHDPASKDHSSSSPPPPLVSSSSSSSASLGAYTSPVQESESCNNTISDTTLPASGNNGGVVAMATTRGDPLSANSDYIHLRGFVLEHEAAHEGVERINNDKLLMLLNSMARTLAKFPSDEAAIDIALLSLPLCASSLPTIAPPIITELQMSALEAFSQFHSETSPSFLSRALTFLKILWFKYPTSLPAAANMRQLSHLVITALKLQMGSEDRTQEAATCGANFVSFLMRHLSDSQVLALESEGVYKQLRSLIMFYDTMSLDELRQIVIGVGTFAEIKSSAMEYLEENSYIGFIQALLKYPSDEALQILIWQLFSVLCRAKKFMEGLLEAGILDSVLSLLQSEGVNARPVVRFLMVISQTHHESCANAGISKKDLVCHLLGMLKVDDVREKAADELLVNLCELLAKWCHCYPKHIETVLELKVVSRLEDCARVRPDTLLYFACVAIEGVCNAISSSSSPHPSWRKGTETLKAMVKGFGDQNHHLFFKDMLSDQYVSGDSKLVKLVYITFQKILKPLDAEGLEKVHTKEFIEFFSICFIRDTLAFQGLVSRIAFSTHFFVFEIKTKEPIAILNELSFHTIVGMLLERCTSTENICTTMGLLACMVSKYHEYLKDVKPFLEANIPNVLLDKAKLLGTQLQFSEDFGRIMLNLTADKELSMKLFEDDYLNKLMDVFEKRSMLGVRRSVIHAIGNIALGGQNIKQVLLDKEVYNQLFTILRVEMKTADAPLISACCRVLHILASGDWVKRKFVESGCIELLLRIMRTRLDNSEVQWRPLGLLSSLGFMAVINRRFILTDEIMEAVATLLHNSNNGKVISYTTLVFLGSDELDSGARKLREMNIVESLQEAIDNPTYRKQAPDLERWGVHVLEKQNLYTVSFPQGATFLPPPPCSISHPSDWPPYVTLESSVDQQSSSPSPLPLSSQIRLLPMDEAYFKSHTPIAPVLTDSARQQLSSLGLNPDKPLFRIGRVYGSTHGLCSNCDKECHSEELVIRPLGMTVEQYQQLVDCGWYRRGGVKMFRLRNNHNIECCDWETRVLANQFDHRKHKSYKKVLRRMPVDRLTVETLPAHFSREAFDLYNTYHVKKHDKPLKSEYSYCEHVVNTPTTLQTVDGIEYGTFHQLYRLDGKLVAVGIIDVIPKGMVSIYMWYDVTKEISKYSFGVYSALKEIEMVQTMSKRNPEIEYYYLQGWNCNNSKLNYKANYEPEQFYCPCIVHDWVSSLDGVSRAKEETVSRANTARGKDETDQVKLEEGAVSQVETGSGEGTSQSVEASTSDKKDASNSVPSKQVECRAFPLDKKRHETSTSSDLDIRKIVICLNYSEYLYLDTLLQKYKVNSSQQQIMESRFNELYFALSPKLRDQLVVDIMVPGVGAVIPPPQDAVDTAAVFS